MRPIDADHKKGKRCVMDLISRQAAIDALDGEITVTGRVNAEAVRGYANLVCDRIKRLPSAQPELRRILDDAEKRYLKGVIRPFRDRVRYIAKICVDHLYDEPEL